MRHPAPISSLCAALLCLAACDSSDCGDNRSSLPIAGFRASSFPTQAIALDSLGIAGIGAPADSVMLLRDASQAYLPLDFEKHVTSFVLRYRDIPEALFDTITFRYDPEPWFVSTECGVIYRYEMRDIDHTTHFVDSVTCPSQVIDNTPGENIFIYFRTDSPDAAPKPVKP